MKVEKLLRREKLIKEIVISKYLETGYRTIRCGQQDKVKKNHKRYKNQKNKKDRILKC